MPKQLAIFDLDGTILDTLADLHQSVNHALSCSGFPLRTLNQVRQDVGNGIRKLIERSVPAGTPDSAADRVYRDFTAHYAGHCADLTKPYPGIPELLPALRRAGFRTAVVSNKADYAVRTLCEHFYPGQFDMILGERPDIPKKPAPDPVFRVLKDLCCSPGDAVYIGDSEVDIETARNAGIPCVSVDWGFRERSLLTQAGGAPIVSSPAELFRLLTGL